MKIGIFTPYLDSLTGGEKYMLSLASCLSSNHRITLFWDTNDPRALKKDVRQKLGIDLTSVTFASNIFSKKISFLKRFFESGKFDLIIFLSDGSIPLLRCNLIVHFQFPVEWVEVDLISKLKIERIKKIICNSKFTSYYIDRKFSVKSAVLYPPVYIAKQKEGESEKINAILHVGRFEETFYKKQDVLIKAFRKLINGGLKNWKLVFVMSVKKMDGKNVLKLEDLAKGLPIEFRHNLEREELLKLYGKSKIYWHATGFSENLKKHPEKAEHFGITTVEAMSYGCVPVVINVGGQKEIVEDNQNGYVWDTVDELVSKTERLINDQRLWEKLSEKAREDSKQFSEERFCQGFTKILNEG